MDLAKFAYHSSKHNLEGVEQKLWDIKQFGTLFAGGEPKDSNFVYLGEDIDIRDSVPGKEITWVLVNGLFIADRVICQKISWDQLDTMGFVEGREVTVGENKYLCRLPKVGCFNRDPNEWDAAVNPDYRDKPPLYVKLSDGRLAIDRGTIRKIKRSMFSWLRKT